MSIAHSNGKASLALLKALGLDTFSVKRLTIDLDAGKVATMKVECYVEKANLESFTKELSRFKPHLEAHSFVGVDSMVYAQANLRFNLETEEDSQ
jgi:hypothetical protein